MKSFHIRLFGSGKNVEDLHVTIPLAMINIAVGLIPMRIRLYLETCGIDLFSVAQLPAIQKYSGELIEIETSDGRLTISAEEDTRKKAPKEPESATAS